jgi:hypothetical protein
LNRISIFGASEEHLAILADAPARDLVERLMQAVRFYRREELTDCVRMKTRGRRDQMDQNRDSLVRHVVATGCKNLIVRMRILEARLLTQDESRVANFKNLSWEYLENCVNVPLRVWSISSGGNDDIACNVAFEIAWTVFKKDEQFAHRSTHVLVVN